MTSTGFSVADPDDAGMLDVVGFDTATPPVIADFARAQATTQWAKARLATAAGVATHRYLRSKLRGRAAGC